jgi:L-seryl-tRNA(Ser) seleniumtransferase
MLALPIEQIDRRAAALAADLCSRGLSTSVVDGESTVGGGSAPGAVLPTRLVAVTHPALGAAKLEARIRSQPIPVIARIENGRVVVDLRTVDPADDPLLAAAFADGAASA